MELILIILAALAAVFGYGQFQKHKGKLEKETQIKGSAQSEQVKRLEEQAKREQEIDVQTKEILRSSEERARQLERDGLSRLREVGPEEAQRLHERNVARRRKP